MIVSYYCARHFRAVPIRIEDIVSPHDRAAAIAFPRRPGDGNVGRWEGMMK